MKFCSNCGEKLEKNTKFCTKCGTKIDSSVSQRGSNEIVNRELTRDKSSKITKLLIFSILLVVLIGIGILVYTQMETDNSIEENTVMETEQESGSFFNKEEERGNTPGNLLNGGFIVQNGDFFYYKNDNIVRTDGISSIPLNTKSSYDLNIVGDWIYYIDLMAYDIYKMDLEGNNVTLILDAQQVLGINVVGDWIYYYTEWGKNSIYKVKTDGSEITSLGAEYAYDLNVVGDWIYYSYSKDNYSIYKMRTDGSNQTRVYNSKAYELNVIGDWIYYIGIDEKVHKVKTDGTKETQLYNDKYLEKINVSGDWIYMVDNNNDLYKMRTDGSEFSFLTEGCERVNVIGDWLYMNVNYSTKIYKMRTDGSELQEFR